VIPGHGLDRQPRRQVVVGVVVALALASLASVTHPFTVAADIVTGFPIVVAAVIVAVAMRTRSPRPEPVDRADGHARPNRLWLVWVVAAVAIAGWELYCYTAGPRSAHPTLSSLLDTLDATHAGKTLAFGAWLALGWYLVRP
jgi:hypothetical protein